MAAGRGFAMPGDVPSPERTLTHLTGFKQRAAKKYVAPVVFAFANAQLKRKEETLRYLEESYQQRSPELVFVQNDPNYDFVHSDPRYRAIIKTMGLPRAY
jgi:hypothetical protein